MHEVSSYRGNRPTNTHTHKQTNTQTGPITIHCAAKLSAQCNHQPLQTVFMTSLADALRLSLGVGYIYESTSFDRRSTPIRPRYDHSTTYVTTYAAQVALRPKQTSGRPPRYAPAPLLPLWASKRIALPSTTQRSSSFPRPIRSHAHRCS